MVLLASLRPRMICLNKQGAPMRVHNLNIKLQETLMIATSRADCERLKGMESATGTNLNFEVGSTRLLFGSTSIDKLRMSIEALRAIWFPEA
jgi:hypothetical protein